MNHFNPGDLVCLKDRFSPEMMLIEESNGTGTVVWQNAIGEAMTDDYPAAALETIPLAAGSVPASVLRFADLLRHL